MKRLKRLKSQKKLKGGNKIKPKMPSGVYSRNEKHREISRKGGLASPTKFKKGHKVLDEWKEKYKQRCKGKTLEALYGKEKAEEIKRKISKPGNKNPAWKYGTKSYYRNIARRKIEENYDEIPKGVDIHHIDKDVTNNNLSNLKMLTHSEHTKTSLA